jgi:23S rRNA (guanine745-N1)-methyltransferase
MPGGARPGTADTAGMVAARGDFLAAGHYAPLAGAVADLAAGPLATGTPAAGGEPAVLDAGAGTGYYLAAVLDRLGPRAAGLAMDISTRALRRAARAHPAIGAVAWDVWQPLPVRDQAVSLIINVFAPRNGPEFRRVLRPDGALIVVTPAPEHLAGLAGAGLLAVDERKEQRLAATLDGPFRLAGRQDLVIPLSLGRADAETLIGMGPAAHHTDPAVIRDRLAGLPDPVPVTAAFRLSVYRPVVSRHRDAR